MKLRDALGRLNRRQREMLLRILSGGALLIIALFLPEGGLARVILCLAAYIAVGWRVLFKAGKNIAHGHVFDENFLMCVASIGAIVAGEHVEAVAVMLFYQVGELFESCAVGASRRSVAALMDIRPESARVEREGAQSEIDPEEVAVGETIVVLPGERIPLDGRVTEGVSTLDQSALTGESLPVETGPGADVYSGAINLSGVLRVRVSKPYVDSTVAKILDLVENAAERKAHTESFITRFAAVYTPVVCIAAVLLAVVPSLITGAWSLWPKRTLAFLVVSCPCALVISVPLSFFGGIGGASASGILIKGSSCMEALAKADCVVFDKTGTLTCGSFEVTQLFPVGIGEKALLEKAAYAEYGSAHPISRSLVRAFGGEIDLKRIGSISEFAGQGVIADIDGREIACGNFRLMETMGIRCEACDAVGTSVYVAEGGRYIGCIVIADTLKPGSRDAVRALKKSGVKKTVMLTGDRREIAEAVAREAGIDEVRAELLPAQKVEALDGLIGEGHSTVFVGDGLNDAPVLARADVGIAMGALGSDAAIEAADVVLMDDDPKKVAAAITLSRRTLRIARQNIAFALAVKLAVLILGALGLTGMGAAVFADVGVSVIAILNAMRALRVPGRRES